MSAQAAHLAATCQCQRTILAFYHQFTFQSLESLLSHSTIFRVNIPFIHSFCISIHELRGHRCFREVSFPFRLVEYLIPQTIFVLISGQHLSQSLYPANHPGTSFVVFGNEIQRIHHRHEPPSDTPSPEVRRMSCFRICPTLALAFIPGMMIKPGFGIIRMFLAKRKLLYRLINPFGFVELRTILCEERRCHI